MSVDLMFSVANGISKGLSGYEFSYCLEESKFYIYKSGYWQQLADLEIMALILETYSGKEGLLDITRFTVSKRNQILENLKQLIFKRLDCFNKSGYLNFDIGEFDPVTGTMHDHKKENYSTLRFNYPHHHSAKCDLWLKTLNEIFEGQQERVDILQEFFGYCLTRDTRKEKALLLLGESRTGKSTILEMLSGMICKNNCAFVPLTHISNQQYSPLLMNKLINIDTDASSKADDYEREFRIITSGEPLTCNQKFVETFEFNPYCKLAMAANQFPRITDHSSAFYNRLILLPCDRVFKMDEQNNKLKDELKSELPGVFNWAVEGLQRLNKRGQFEQKKFMSKAIQDLRQESNPTETFFEEFIEVFVADDSYLDKGELYGKYKLWCQANQYYTLNSARFAQAINTKYYEHTPKDTQKDGRRVWRNLRYKTGVAEAQSNIGWQD